MATQLHQISTPANITLQTWNTGPLLADSCGYIVISHPPSPPRIIVASRGTYSVANTIVDLSTVPQEYIPYPGGDTEESSYVSTKDQYLSSSQPLRQSENSKSSKCDNCVVHAGFMTSWKHTRPYVTPHLEELVEQYPEYQLTLVGHSLGGAVAGLASLDFKSRGWNPQVTTFGEPRIGNIALMHYMDKAFWNEDAKSFNSMYRRVTHVDDPVPLLPLKEWGYRMHAGEIFISKPDLSPSVADLQYCIGDEDPDCIAAADPPNPPSADETEAGQLAERDLREWWNGSKSMWAVPSRYRVWQLFFAHRDYFWRLGLCLPGGDPTDWYRKYPSFDDGTE